MRAIARIVCLAAILATPTQAEDRRPAVGLDPMPPFRPVQGAFFALSVANMAESIQWYSQKLGLSVAFEARGEVDVTVLEGSGLLVELIRDPSAMPRSVPRPELVYGPFKAGFVVTHFESVVAQLRARGVQIAFGPYPAHDNQRANVIILDNSGNLIQVFGDR